MPEASSITVMVKLHLRGTAFAALPLSNAPDNERAIAFKGLVAELLAHADPGQQRSRIVQFAANVGVFSVVAPACVLTELLTRAEIQSADVVDRAEARKPERKDG